MNVKIDTKEKFTVVTPKEADIPANMTGELAQTLNSYLEKNVPHVVLNMKDVNTITENVAETIAVIQQQFYEKSASFIVCELQKNVQDVFDSMDLSEAMNLTPTESEAWDIVQMEEIERELMAGFDDGSED